MCAWTDSTSLLASFEGNIWAGETKATMGLDERADEGQREGLQTIFGGQQPRLLGSRGSG